MTTGKTVEMTKENYQELIDGNSTIIIDFWAQWCGPCKSFGPIFEQSAAKHPDVLFAKVDTEAQQELGGWFGISSIPTVAVFRDQIMLYKEAGMIPEAGIDDLLAQVAQLDMDDVRSKVEEEREAKAVT